MEGGFQVIYEHLIMLVCGALAGYGIGRSHGASWFEQISRWRVDLLKTEFGSKNTMITRYTDIVAEEFQHHGLSDSTKEKITVIAKSLSKPSCGA